MATITLCQGDMTEKAPKVSFGKLPKIPYAVKIQVDPEPTPMIQKRMIETATSHINDAKKQLADWLKKTDAAVDKSIKTFKKDVAAIQKKAKDPASYKKMLMQRKKEIEAENQKRVNSVSDNLEKNMKKEIALAGQMAEKELDAYAQGGGRNQHYKKKIAAKIAWKSLLAGGKFTISLAAVGVSTAAAAGTFGAAAPTIIPAVAGAIASSASAVKDIHSIYKEVKELTANLDNRMTLIEKEYQHVAKAYAKHQANKEKAKAGGKLAKVKVAASKAKGVFKAENTKKLSGMVKDYKNAVDRMERKANNMSKKVTSVNGLLNKANDKIDAKDHKEVVKKLAIAIKATNSIESKIGLMEKQIAAARKYYMNLDVQIAEVKKEKNKHMGRLNTLKGGLGKVAGGLQDPVLTCLSAVGSVAELL